MAKKSKKRNKNIQPPRIVNRDMLDKARGSSLLDIIIPVFKRIDLLKQCLAAIPEAADGIAYDIIIVDNGTPREDCEQFYSTLDNFKGITILRNKENIGFPKACNQGVKRKNAPLILLLNSDVILQPKSILGMVSKLDDPTVGVVGLKLLFPDNVGELNAKIRPAKCIQHIGMHTDIHADFKHIMVGWHEDNPRTQNWVDPYAITGACLMTRRSLWNKVGGLFEGYGHGTYEDVDFCLCIRELGLRVVLEHNTFGYHYTGATAETYKIQFPMIMNKMTFMSRWGAKLNYTEWMAL